MVPPFFAEQLGNIHLIRATLAADKTCKVDTLLAIKEQALWLKENKLMQLPVSENASLALMTVVPLEQPSVHNNVLWDIKLSAHTPKACLQEPKEWLPAKEMKTLQVLDCHHCHAPLLKAEDARVPFKHKDLPSEHWYELVECWICHETKPEEHKARMKPILAKPDVFLVGATYFLVHVDNLVQGCTAMDPHVASKINWDSGTFTKWIAIQCTHCNAPLGEGHYEQHKEAKVLRAVKLFKYCVSIHPSPAAQPTFIDFLVCDMVEAAKAHATYRFIIQGRSSEKVYALIWLFNWDTRVFYNDGFVGSGESSTLYNERGKINNYNSWDGLKG
ncbi:HECT-like ubiquitin-conjugating enzyme-binding-domain-containing protein [Spinellus fusiger]|nr:HECT-like ubiquitin-conjugating enzyme-binding-domain-containing protein [Spinellus fusiger]